MKSIKQILMDRDGMTEKEADAEIEAAQEDLHARLANGEIPSDICSEWFGLEPDFIDQLL